MIVLPGSALPLSWVPSAEGVKPDGAAGAVVSTIKLKPGMEPGLLLVGCYNRMGTLFERRGWGETPGAIGSNDDAANFCAIIV